MTILRSEGAGDPDLGFYNGAVSNSLRLDGLNHTLQRTLVNSTDGSRQKNVWSFWTKFNTSGVSPNPYFYSKGDGGGVADIVYISITSSQRLLFIGYVGDSVTHNIITTRQFRDPNAWYHIVVAVDTTQTTDANKVCIYVNGVKETAFDTASYPSTNALLAMNWYQTGNAGSTVEMISDYRASPHEDYRIDGYLAEYHSVDGLSFFSDTSGTANTSFNINSFGETKNGVWIPVAYTGSHGTQGYHLKFIGTGTSQSSGAVASPTNIGDDSSGQNNHWAVNNLSSHDANIPDCPENNWCTMNPNSPTQGSPNFAEGSLKVSISSNAYSYFQSSFGVTSGKWYAEYRVVTVGSTMVGIAESNMEKYYTGANNDPHLTGGTAWYVNGSHGYFDGSSVSGGTFSSSTTYTNGDIIALALDMDSSTKTIKFYKNGSLVNTTNLNANFDEHIVFANNFYSTTAGVWNFGQDGSFAGILTGGDVGTETDGNGLGTFKYSVPSGYLSLCSANLEDADYATISPNADTQADDHFNTVLYSGLNSTAQDITVGFVPDWVWIKTRNAAISHMLYDSSRGATKFLQADATGPEGTGADSLTDFDVSGGGFSLGVDSSTTAVNNNGKTYVAWNWKANGGTTSSNSDGSITSTVQANTTSGFSIVTFQGNQTAGATVGHGLGKVPKWIILKNRNIDGNGWIVYHEIVDQTDFLFLNNTNARADNATRFDDTKPTDQVFSLGADANINDNGEDIIAYCFADIEGYSKFGSYTGNGSTDGVFIYLGFRPAFIITKQINATGNWIIMDSVRSSTNVGGHWLYADGAFVEDTGSSRYYDFVSNGFKLRNGGTGQNDTGDTYIYIAFAENPFKYANAR